MTMIPVSSQSPPSSAPLPRKQSILILIGLLCGVLLEAIDTNMLNSSMRTIVRELHGGIQMSPWVITAYLIALTVMTPIYGRLSDLYGRLPFYLVGMSLFMLGSICSGFAQNLTQLILFRVVQGLGAGAMMPIAITLAQTVFPPEQRGKVQGMIPMAFGVSAIFAPTLGGFVTDTLGWRWLFYLNLPFGLIAIGLLATFLPTSARTGMQGAKPKLDIFGMGTLVGFSVALMMGLAFLSEATMTLDSWQVLVSFALALALFIAFIIVEQTSAHPLISLQLFKNPTFALSVVAAFLLGGVVLWSAAVYVSIFMQSVLKISATRSGTLLTPMMLAIAVGSGVCGRLLGTRIREYKILALIAGGFVIVGTGLLSLANPESSITYITISMVLTGVGIGATFPLYGMVAANHVERRLIGLSFGLIAFARNLGASVSLACFGTLFARSLNRNILALLPPGLPESVKHRILLGFSMGGEGQTETFGEMMKQLPPSFAFSFQHGMKAALGDSLHQVFLGGFCVAIVAFLVALCLPKGRLELKG